MMCRAIFQSTLVLLCFIAFNEPLVGPIEVFDATEVTDWEHFAKNVAACSTGGNTAMPGESDNSTNDLHANLGLDFVTNGRPALAERWIRRNSCRWRLDKFIDGKEKQMDYVSLLSTTTRLLRRCTPWGIGDAMGDILATINIGY
ncbi:hypothetical protein P389DRAFT_83761 [Cystobasidium minutum MCA 4210]|uniref:uncharacterized protein n=1 Tax=Cystobasidium minutum MCA 4210 TaxID=1397322 RepID=UPI0034CF8107|eukprot:jgi/Rhomi1/83761/CE83760_216